MLGLLQGRNIAIYGLFQKPLMAFSKASHGLFQSLSLPFPKPLWHFPKPSFSHTACTFPNASCDLAAPFFAQLFSEVHSFFLCQMILFQRCPNLIYDFQLALWTPLGCDFNNEVQGATFLLGPSQISPRVWLLGFSPQDFHPRLPVHLLHNSLHLFQSSRFFCLSQSSSRLLRLSQSSRPLVCLCAKPQSLVQVTLVLFYYQAFSCPWPWLRLALFLCLWVLGSQTCLGTLGCPCSLHCHVV